MKNKKWALIVGQSKDITGFINDVLVSEGFSCQTSYSIDEALLKLSNQDFSFISIDLDSIGVTARDFVSGLRKKEAKKNIKDKTSVLISGSVATIYNRNFTHFDNVKFISYPLEIEELKRKISSTEEKTDVIFDNTRFLKEGEILLKEGGDGHEMFWILDGEFEIVKNINEEKEMVLGAAGTGELVGEMSFLDDLPRSASIRAKVKSEVLVIPQLKFANVLNEQPRWFRSLMKTLSQRLRDANKKISKTSN